MLYGGDTLTTSFDSDTVSFVGNNGFYKFDGTLRTTNINFNELTLFSGQDLLINYANGDYMLFEQSGGSNIFDLALNGGGISLYMDAAGNFASITGIGTYLSAINVNNNDGRIELKGENATRQATVTMSGNGLEYLGDYSSTLTDRGIPDFGKIKSTIHDSLVANPGGGSSYTFTDGLTESPAGTVILGGNFTTGRTVTLNNNMGFTFQTAGYPYFELFHRAASYESYYRINSYPFAYSTLRTGLSSPQQYGQIEVYSSSIEMRAYHTGTLAHVEVDTAGLVYGSDYSNRWHNTDSLRRIPNIGFVRNQIHDSITIPKFYAACADSTTVVSMTQNDTVQLTNATNNVLTEYRNRGGFTLQGDSIQIPSKAGYYLIDLRVGFSGNNLDVYNAFVYVDNALVENRGHFRRTTTNASTGSASLLLNYNFSGSEWVKIMVVNTGTNNDLTINNMDVYITYD